MLFGVLSSYHAAAMPQMLPALYGQPLPFPAAMPSSLFSTSITRSSTRRRSGNVVGGCHVLSGRNSGSCPSAAAGFALAKERVHVHRELHDRPLVVEVAVRLECHLFRGVALDAGTSSGWPHDFVDLAAQMMDGVQLVGEPHVIAHDGV